LSSKEFEGAGSATDTKTDTIFTTP
jgi:hypothetical protein